MKPLTFCVALTRLLPVDTKCGNDAATAKDTANDYFDPNRRSLDWCYPSRSRYRCRGGALMTRAAVLNAYNAIPRANIDERRAAAAAILGAIQDDASSAYQAGVSLKNAAEALLRSAEMARTGRISAAELVIGYNWTHNSIVSELGRYRDQEALLSAALLKEAAARQLPTEQGQKSSRELWPRCMGPGCHHPLDPESSEIADQVCADCAIYEERAPDEEHSYSLQLDMQCAVPNCDERVIGEPGSICLACFDHQGN